MNTDNTEQLNRLETTLLALKDRYRSEGVYSDTKMADLQLIAKREYRPFTKFEGHYTGAWGLCLLVQDKVAQGYTCRTDDPQSASLYGAGSFWVYMMKPDDLVSSEMIELEKKVSVDYSSSLETTKARLLSEIASTQLEIKMLNEQIRAQEEHDSEYQTMLALVQEELSQLVIQKPTNTEPVPHIDVGVTADATTEAE